MDSQLRIAMKRQSGPRSDCQIVSLDYSAVSGSRPDERTVWDNNYAERRSGKADCRATVKLCDATKGASASCTIVLYLGEGKIQQATKQQSAFCTILLYMGEGQTGAQC